jgi:hypothetical protein
VLLLTPPESPHFTIFFAQSHARKRTIDKAFSPSCSENEHRAKVDSLQALQLAAKILHGKLKALDPEILAKLSRNGETHLGI